MEETFQEILTRLIHILPDDTTICHEFSEADAVHIAVLLDAYYFSRNSNLKDQSYFIPTRINALKDRLYEIIHTGHWSKVNTIIRKTFTMATYFHILCYIKIQLESNTNEFCASKLIYELDYGLLLGYSLSPPHHNLLTKAIDIISNYEDLSNKQLLESVSCIKERLRMPTEFINSDVPIISQPTVEHFRQTFFETERPVIVTDCMLHWPAYRKWHNLNYLLKSARFRTVPIEIGENYTQSNWSQDLVSFGDFISKQMTLEHQESESGRIEYLAQHNLFEQIPHLRDDLCIPEYCCLTMNAGSYDQSDIDIRAWLGPAGTVTPMHTDAKHNLLSQVFGHKDIILAAPEESVNLYPHENVMLQNTSQVDPENVDLLRFPLSAHVRWYRIRLYRGEMLYIPPKWWHHVRALDRSFSVSFWWN